MGFARLPDGRLAAEEVSLADLARDHGTPTFVYSAAAMRGQIAALDLGLAGHDHLVCYAVKACPNLAVLGLMREQGLGFDAGSLGELARVLKVGGDPRRTLLSGVGKRDDEIDVALHAGVMCLAVESREELAAVSGRAAAGHLRAPVSLRFNPDIDPHTHPHVATGLRQSKFGVPASEVPALASAVRADPHLDLVGLSVHLGSQIVSLEPLVAAASRLLELATTLSGSGHPLTFLSVGGGLGVVYTDERPPTPAAYGEAMKRVLAPLGLRLVVEPGRALVGNAGVLLCRVLRKKRTESRTFVVLDAGMNDLVRPALYGARHAIEPVAPARSGRERVDVVGPLCESADTFGRDLDLPVLEPGDLVVVRTAGAYGFSMASTYNGRPRAAEVLVSGGSAQLVREREGIADLWRGERRLDGTAADDTLPGPVAEREP